MNSIVIIQIVVAVLFSSVVAGIIKILYDKYKRKILLIRSQQGIPTVVRQSPDDPMNAVIEGEELNNGYTFDVEIENVGNEEIENQYIRFEFDTGAKILSENRTLPSPEHKFELDDKTSTKRIRRYLINLLKPKQKIGISFVTVGNKENLVKIDALGKGVKVVKSIEDVKPKHKVVITTLFLSLLLSLFASYAIWEVTDQNRLLRRMVEFLTSETRKQAELNERKTVVAKSLVTVMVKSGEKIVGRGTGFFVSEFGHIITAYHVISEAREIFVQPSQDSTKFRAVVVDSSKAEDLALLKVTLPRFSEKYGPVIFADSTFKPSIVEQVHILRIGTVAKDSTYLYGYIRPVSEDTIILRGLGPVYRGLSGSPVFFGDDGPIVGMFSSGERVKLLDDVVFPMIWPRYRLISVDRIKDLLRKNAIPFAENLSN